MNNSFSKIAILIPSFNPNHNLLDFVKDLSTNKWSEIVLINDGSSEESQIVFDSCKTIKNVHIINHSKNQGKGVALKTGIKYLSNKSNRIDGLITVDSDGQHLVKDINKIAKSAIYKKNNVFFGIRLFDKNTPFKSSFGNKLTKNLLYLLNGISINDSQTGLRYLPISILDGLLKLPGEKYEYELECLFAIKDLGYSITEIPITTVYIDNNSGSHFRPLIDSARIYLVFLKFSLSSLLSFVIDIGMFILFFFYFESIYIATMISRIISGIFNFTINRSFVFNINKKSKLLKELISYFILWATLLCLSALIVSIEQGSSAFRVVPFKILVDLSLFLLSFYVQKNIIFKSK